MSETGEYDLLLAESQRQSEGINRARSLIKQIETADKIESRKARITAIVAAIVVALVAAGLVLVALLTKKKQK